MDRLRRRLKFRLAGRQLAAALFVGQESADDLDGRGVGRGRRSSRAERDRREPLSAGDPRPTGRCAECAWSARGTDGASLRVRTGNGEGGDVFLATLRDLLARGRDVIGVSVGAPEQAARRQARTSDSARPCASSLPPTPSSTSTQRRTSSFTCPSRSEGDPYAALEAAASGLAVVASAAPGQTAGPAAPPRAAGRSPCPAGDRRCSRHRSRAVRSSSARRRGRPGPGSSARRTWARTRKDGPPVRARPERPLTFDNRLDKRREPMPSSRFRCAHYRQRRGHVRLETGRPGRASDGIGGPNGGTGRGMSLENSYREACCHFGSRGGAGA